jgi:hypothetical protein
MEVLELVYFLQHAIPRGVETGELADCLSMFLGQCFQVVEDLLLLGDVPNNVCE